MGKMRKNDYFAEKALELIAMAIKGARLGDAEVCPVCGRKRTRTVSEQEKVSLKERARKAWETHSRKAAERRKMKEEGGKSLE